MNTDNIKQPDFSKLKGIQFSAKHFDIHYPELKKIIEESTPKELSFQEKIYWYVNNICQHPTCIICSKPTVFINGHVGYRKYCSRKCMNSDPEKIKQVKETNTKKYGGQGYASKMTEEKCRKTCIERYGVEVATQNREIYAKARKTCIERYGVEFASQNEDIKQKQYKTCYERYGDPFYNNQEKSKQTCIEKYGVSNPMLLGKENLIKTKLEQSKQRYNDIIDVVNEEWLCKCPHSECDKCEEKSYITPKNVPRDRMRSNAELCTKLLPVGNPSRSSTLELKVQSWLDEWNIEYEIGNRIVIGPKELDIWIPSKNIAIEINGCYWHSDMEKPKNYHINKFKDCQQKGIQLIQVWEDWLIKKEDIVKSFLQAKLGICDNTIYARKCDVREIEAKEANQFLNENHIQGKCNSNYRLGLFYNDKLVAVMCFSKRSALSGPKKLNNKEAELIRFCNLRGYRVVGGASKLLKYYIKLFSPDIITSYSANDISNGQLYSTLGFKTDHKISESYWYIEPGTCKREHRSIYTRSGIVRKWPEYDINDKSWTERSVMDLKGYNRIYDAGTTKWTLKLK